MNVLAILFNILQQSLNCAHVHGPVYTIMLFILAR